MKSEKSLSDLSFVIFHWSLLVISHFSLVTHMKPESRKSESPEESAQSNRRDRYRLGLAKLASPTPT
jgi:hypothetical protein